MSSIAVGALELTRADITHWSTNPQFQSTAVLSDIAGIVGRPLRVAVVRLDGIGDWVLTLPLLLALTAEPSVQSVTAVAPLRHAKLLNLSQGVEVHAESGLTILDPARPGGTLGKVVAVSRIGQRRAFEAGSRVRGTWDVVIAARWDTDLGQNARAWALGTGATILGFDPRSRSDATRTERAEASLMTLPLFDSRSAVHEIEHTRALSRHLGLRDRATEGYGAEYFQVGVQESNGVTMHVSSMEPKRRWPAANWREIARHLTGNGVRVTLVGGPEDAHLHSIISEGLGPLIRSVAGEVGLADLPRVLAQSSLFIGNDSGPMHIAASIGIATLVVSPHPIGGDDSHRNSPTRYGPWGTQSRVVRPERVSSICSRACVATSPHCILAVTPQMVIEAVDAILPDI